MATKTLERLMPDGTLIVATLRDTDGYFSLTGEVYDKHGTWDGAAQRRNGREPDVCGMVHEDILRAFPHLKPFQELHLSDASGVPMHGEANGWYWYSRFDGKGTHLNDYGDTGRTDLDVCKEHLRVKALPNIADREDFRTFVDGLRKQWEADAKVGAEFLADAS